MIVKIFPPVVKGFPAVRYNYNKMDRNAGELMKIGGFGALQGFGILRPDDYRQYLTGLATLNKGISHPQFHATISAKGRSTSKEQLTELGARWLEAMGYGNQPYLIIFHKDTLNNHVHLVSCRVDREGKKISSGFERKRGISTLNRLLGLEEGLGADKDLKDALAYRFSTKAQFAMILERKGYIVKDHTLIKYGKKLSDIPVADVQQTIAAYVKDEQRAAQLKAIFAKYRREYSAHLMHKTIPLPGGLQKITEDLRSDLAGFLKDKFGVELLFHHVKERQPYGYTVIDHAQKIVFKGSEVMPLKELLEYIPSATKQHHIEKEEPEIIADPDSATLDYYNALLGAADNYPTPEEGLRTLGVATAGGYITNTSAGLSIPKGAFEGSIRISIADDVDDQQIHGMRRRRQKKARTNTR